MLPRIGGEKLSAITTADLQVLVDRWQARDSGVHHPQHDQAAAGDLPAGQVPRRAAGQPDPRPGAAGAAAARGRDRRARDAAAQLLAALPAEDRPVWATALYAGLRYGELRALRWGAVDPPAGTIAVRESWDPKEGRDRPQDAHKPPHGADAGALRELFVDRRLSGRRRR